jgi:hypothetical protein
VAALGLGLALTAAACGGGDGGSSPTTVSTIPLPTTTTIGPPARLDPADQRAAERAVLRRSDLGGGWRAEPWPEGHQPFMANVEGDCAYLKAVEDVAHLTARAPSPQFGQRATSEVVAAKVQVYDTPEAAAAAFAAFADPRTPDCLGRAIAGFVTVSGPGGALEGLRFEPVPLTTPQAAGYTGVLSARVGAPVRISMGFAAVLRGRALGIAVAYRFDGTAPVLDPRIARLAERLPG